jgi:predicted DNA binding protein
MSVVLEFSVPATDFQLGEVLSAPLGVQIELERVVPTGDMIAPYVWATGERLEEFAATVRERPSVEGFRELDRVGESRLYRIEWAEPPVDLIEGISVADVVVLEARGDDVWSFRLRFTDQEALSAFHDHVTDHDIPVRVERTYAPSDAAGEGDHLDLSPEQREALVLALERGYFETPSEVTLAELAVDRDITPQALSDRIRRANRAVLTTVLRPVGADPPKTG